MTEAALHGGRTDEAGIRERLAEQARAAKDEMLALLGEGAAVASAGWLDRLDDAYWVSFDADALGWHAREMARSAESAQAATAT